MNDCSELTAVHLLVMPHTNSKDRFGEGELQHQFVFCFPWLTSIIPDQHWCQTITTEKKLKKSAPLWFQMTQNLKKKVLYDMFVIHEIGLHFSLLCY